MSILAEPSHKRPPVVSALTLVPHSIPGGDAASGNRPHPHEDPDLPQAAQGGEKVGQQASNAGTQQSAEEQRLDERIRSELHVSRPALRLLVCV